MEGPVNILVWLAYGVLVAFLANSRGRNPFAWFALGLLAPCVSIILVFVLPDLNLESAKDEARNRKVRRLSEQLDQERQKNQSFRKHTLSRLDAHDQVLAMDTRSVGPPELPPVNEEEEPDEPDLAGLPKVDWYTAVAGGQPEGPFRLAQMRDRFMSGELNAKTLIWHETMDNWKTAEQSPLKVLL